MANSKILLLEPVQGLGFEGDTVTVRAGYARNYLLPRKKALPINQANRKYIDSLLRARELREMKEGERARAMAEKVESLRIAIAVKTGEGGKMFGYVTANDLINRLAEEGVKVAKKQLNMSGPVKELGSHSVQIKLYKDLEVDFNFEVVSENPIEESSAEATSE